MYPLSFTGFFKQTICNEPKYKKCKLQYILNWNSPLYLTCCICYLLSLHDVIRSSWIKVKFYSYQMNDFLMSISTVTSFFAFLLTFSFLCLNQIIFSVKSLDSLEKKGLRIVGQAYTIETFLRWDQANSSCWHLYSVMKCFCWSFEVW